MTNDMSKADIQRPSWITDQLIERTKQLWQRRCNEPIDDAMAIEFILSATRLWDTLSEIPPANRPRGPARRCG
jgi:hypothetical protein